MFLNKTLWLWCCSLCYLNGSHPWIPIHIVRLCPHAKPDRTSLWCLFIHAAIYYCLCFLTVQGTWLPKIQCNSIIAASACNHKVLHTHTQCNSHTSTLLSLHSSEGGERGRVQGHSSAHQWAVAGNSSDTSTPEVLQFCIIMFDVMDAFVCIQSSEMNKALFRFLIVNPVNTKKTSHRMFWNMHRVLNEVYLQNFLYGLSVNRKTNLISLLNPWFATVMLQ